MPISAKLEDAAAGQQDLEVNGRADGVPSTDEGHEVGAAKKRKIAWPDVAGLKFGPKRYCQTVKAGLGDEIRIPRYLGGDELNGNMPQGKRAHIHLQVVGGGELSLEIAGDEAPTLPVPSIGA